MVQLIAILRFGYATVACAVLLMAWISLSGAARSHRTSKPIVSYPPCFFNFLCSCSKAVPDLGIVRCQSVPMPRLPPHLNSSKMFMLHLEDNGLKKIEPYFFQYSGLYELEISNNDLTDIPDEAFVGLERSLWKLELRYNELIEVPSRSLRHLGRLKLLDLTGNDISHVEPGSWRSLQSSLEELILAENSIQELPPDAFAGLNTLMTLDLSGNHLRDLDPNVFREGLNSLQKLSLADNQFDEIPYKELSMVKNLRNLDLSYNRIEKMHLVDDGKARKLLGNYRMNLDVLRMEYNEIDVLYPGSFEFFNSINETYFDGNPMKVIQEDAFRPAKIVEIYVRDCGLTYLSPTAFNGMQQWLQVLDLSNNNITILPHNIFRNFNRLRRLSLRENPLMYLNAMESFSSFMYTLNELDIAGSEMMKMQLQEFSRISNLRTLRLSRLTIPHLSAEDFMEFGVELEELSITNADLQSIKSHAFMHVRGLKMIDFSDNNIKTIERDAFEEVGHSLGTLKLSHALSTSTQQVPFEALRPLIHLRYLDMSHNHLRTMTDTCFHFLKKLEVLRLQDNQIDQVFKGTFQRHIHGSLKRIDLSFNNIKVVQQSTFLDIASLEELRMNDNRIEIIDRRSFMNLDRLKHLNLKGNRIFAVSEEAFENLPDLETLDMSYNSLREFKFSMFDQVGTLSMFKVNVSHNSIKELISNTSRYYVRDSMPIMGSGMSDIHSNIKILDMSYNNISQISGGFFRPAETSLTHLYLSHNSLTNTTWEIFERMHHLQWLDLSHNRIYTIGWETFKNTHSLQVLLLSHNHLDDMRPETFRNTKHIRVLDMSNNRLRSLPDSLFFTDALELLDLSSNELNRVPALGMTTMAVSSLCVLDLSRNSISSIPTSDIIGRFMSLVRLDLSYNRLVIVGENAFAPLPRLTDLDLSHNSELILEQEGRTFFGINDTLLKLNLENVSLTFVPELPLPSLRWLSLSRNSLSSVPSELSTNMSQLRSLDLSDNNLVTVPLVVHSLPQLRRLYLASNPIGVMANTSLLGVADRLDELDISRLTLYTFETGVLHKMYSLRALTISSYPQVRNFNITQIIEHNTGLRRMEVNVNDESTLARELSGEFPRKLENIIFSGKGLRSLADNVLEGVRSPEFNFTLRNTSLSSVSREVFLRIGYWERKWSRVRNMTVDVETAGQVRNLENPSTGSMPNLPKATFLLRLRLQGNPLTCDCKIGWVEVWLRKQRQYMCAITDASVPLSWEQEEFCDTDDDDLRVAKCANKGNNSLLEVLKSDIECGWSKANTISGPAIWLLISLPLLWTRYV